MVCDEVGQGVGAALVWGAVVVVDDLFTDGARAGFGGAGGFEAVSLVVAIGFDVGLQHRDQRCCFQMGQGGAQPHRSVAVVAPSEVAFGAGPATLGLKYRIIIPDGRDKFGCDFGQHLSCKLCQLLGGVGGCPCDERHLGFSLLRLTEPGGQVAQTFGDGGRVPRGQFTLDGRITNPGVCVDVTGLEYFLGGLPRVSSLIQTDQGRQGGASGGQCCQGGLIGQDAGPGREPIPEPAGPLHQCHPLSGRE